MLKQLFPFLVLTLISCTKIANGDIPKEAVNLFPEAIEFVLESEGIYSNHKNDLGGETKFGISRRSYPHLDILNLTIDQAKEIYFNDFWKKYNLLRIRDKELAIRLLDTMILMGPRKATILLEESIVQLGYDIPVDGIFDPESMIIINSLPDVKILVDKFQLEMEKFFHDVVKIRPSQKVFLQGWLSRARRKIST